MKVALVGMGPTGLYTFKSLIDEIPDLKIVIFDKAAKAGMGMPYSPENSSASMLANIASIEIPPLTMEYLEWLQRQPEAKLRKYGIDTEDLDDRQFTPRLLLGEYFRDQLLQLIDLAQKRGFQVELREEAEVVDVRTVEGGLTLIDAAGATSGPFDHVILATGHEFPDEDASRASYYPSPWSGLIQAEVPAVKVGIMGTSLSSIDAAMAVACQHGQFRRKDGDLSFETRSQDLKITLMSWTGVLPEADFYYPIPYLPLSQFTEEAVAKCSATPRPLDALFDLFRSELTDADPAYAARIGLAGLDADSFADAYFAGRMEQDPFRWARRNLDEVEYNKAHRITVPWRYAILRMHEPAQAIVPFLSETDRDRFDAGLKKVFVDNYAAVPSESIRRLLALRDAGVLSILELGEDYDLRRETHRTIVTAKGRWHVFDVFIDARGQQPMATADLPFPTLRQALLDEGQELPEVGDDFRLLGTTPFSGRLVLGAIPYLMHDRPFIQGITASHEIGSAIAAGIAGRTNR